MDIALDGLEIKKHDYQWVQTQKWIETRVDFLTLTLGLHDPPLMN